MVGKFIKGQLQQFKKKLYTLYERRSIRKRSFDQAILWPHGLCKHI
jgi:hypothetical protein